MKRAIATGALFGLLVALAVTLPMSTRQIRTVAIPAGHPVVVYGSLGPYAPASLSRVTVQHSPRIARDALLGLLAGALAASALVTVARPRRTTGG